MRARARFLTGAGFVCGSAERNVEVEARHSFHMRPCDSSGFTRRVKTTNEGLNNRSACVQWNTPLCVCVCVRGAARFWHEDEKSARLWKSHCHSSTVAVVRQMVAVITPLEITVYPPF